MDGRAGTKVQSKDFFIKTIFKSARIFFVLMWLVCSGLVFYIFRTVSDRSLQQLSVTIESILRNESSTANTYAISKSISDLEGLNLIECSRLTENIPGGRLFYDSTGRGTCNLSEPFWFSNRVLRINLTALNGSKFSAVLVTPINISDLVLEYLIYLFVGVIWFTIYKIRAFSSEKSRVLIRIAEVEKSLLLQSTQQIKHDMSSPLTAIRFAVDVMKNVEPRHRDVLNRAIKRAEQIFGELAVAQQTTFSRINVKSVLDEILDEKKMVWGLDAEFSFLSEVPSNLLVLGNESDFKRILSNLVNNSFEARKPDSKAQIQIGINLTGQHTHLIIRDLGIGIEECILSKLGTQRVTSGKKHLENSGDGIGVYSSATKLRSWAGDLQIRSQVGHYTDVEIKLVTCA